MVSGRPDHAARMARAVHDLVVVLVNRLEQTGADRPLSIPPPPEVSLALLASSANRRYAETLREAWDAGRAVDEERGWGDDGPAMLIEMVLAKVEQEIHGPARRDR